MSSGETSAELSFLDLGKQGKSAVWRYVLGFTLIIVAYLIGNVACYFVWVLGNGGKHLQFTEQGELVGLDPAWNMIGLGSMFLVMLLGIWLVIRFLHGRSFKSLITPHNSINWKRIAFGFVLWLALSIADQLGNYLIWPQYMHYTFRMPESLTTLLLVAIIIPFQTLAEEMAFRGYLQQGLALLTKNAWILAIVNGFLFMLPHMLTPGLTELLIMALAYFGIGFILAIVTIRTNSIEIAYGAHMANNIFSASIVNYEHSPFPTPAMFTTRLTPQYELIALIISSLIFYALCMKYVSREMKY